MSSSLNSEPLTKQQAYQDLLKYNIQPKDKIFPARETLNKLNSIGRYLLSHSITFEEHHIINHSDNWDNINPQSAFTFNSLQGYHAPNPSKIGSHGVVFTFNNNAHGTYQFVITNHGLAYREINNMLPWLYLGQGIPASVNVTQIVDQQHLRNFFNNIKSLYVDQNELKRTTNSQEAINYNISSANSSLNNKTNHELYSSNGKLSSLQASASSEFNSTSSNVLQTSIHAKQQVQSLQINNGTLFSNIYDSFVPSYTSQNVNSITGSYSVSNDISNFAQYNYSYVPNSEELQHTYKDNDGMPHNTPGSVYVNASLVDEAFHKMNYNDSSVESSINGPFTTSITSDVSHDASSYANSAIQVNNTRGQGYINSSNITSLSGSTANNSANNQQQINSIVSYAQSVGTVKVPQGFKTEQTLLSVGSIQPQNGATILGNDYQPDFNDISLGNETSEEQAQEEVIDQANSLTYQEANSFISRESTLANNGSSLLLNDNNLTSEAANQNTSNLDQARQEDLNDINMYRKQAGIQPLQFATEDQILADLRIAALNYVYHMIPENLHTDQTVHGLENVNGKLISDYALKIIDALHLNNLTSGIGENTADWSIGENAYHNPGYQQPTFVIKNGIDAADDLTDVYVNYDQSQQNGHRNNILNPEYKYLGIAYFEDKNGNGVEVEEFSTTNEDKVPLTTDPIDISKLDFYFNLLPSNNAYSKYIISNAIPVTPGNTYNVSAFVSNSDLNHTGVVGITNSPYLAQYDNPINQNSWNSSAIANIQSNINDIKDQVNVGYINYNFVPKVGVNKVWLVGIPAVSNGTPTFSNVNLTAVTAEGPVEMVNSVASQNANTIATLENNNQALNDKLNSLTNDEGTNDNEFNDYQEHFNSLDNNPTMSLVATKSIASSLSTRESYSDPTVFVYPRFTSAVGLNSRTEEEAIDWCNSTTGGNLSICEQDLEPNVLSNVNQSNYETDYEYKYRIKQITMNQVYVNKAKVAAILGIIEDKTNFGQSGNDTQNYLGYRDYHDEYNDIQPYLTNILAQTVGAWTTFQGDFIWDKGHWYLQGITPNDLAQSSNTDVQTVKSNLPYYLAYWLDYHIDNSNTDMDQCGSNAKSLINELY